ncbi:MAG: LemA family protein [Elusimicrobiota bacterium]|jgi:LemA protein
MNALVLLGLLGFALVGLVAYFVTVYNGLIIVKNNIVKAWANIDVLLKQRHDEIPKLIKTCESYMKFEKDTLTKITALRSTAQGATGVAQRAEAEGQLTAGLRQLFAVAENYPDLKSQASFQQLQGRISDLESQLADRREFYNETVNNYNIRIQSLPDSFVASFMNLQPQEMFKVSEADRQDVAIDIAQP